MIAHRSCPHRGFTLLEVIVAVAVSAIVVLAARGISDRLTEASAGVARVARRDASAARGDWLLRSLIGQIEIAQDADETFGGTPQEATFTTWCLRPAGWEERCRVHLMLVPRAASRVLLAVESDDRVAIDTLAADTLAADTELRYLIDASGGGAWIRRWGEGATVPLAIGMVTPRDTTILRVGPRG